MELRDELLVNMFGQGVLDRSILIDRFSELDISSKDLFLNDLVFLIIQSKASNRDIESAISDTGLKSTFTPCVLLRKGVIQSNLKKIVSLPDDEKIKTFLLLLSLFKISYRRRFELEKDNPHKWWYWDLSKAENINKVINQHPSPMCIKSVWLK